MSTGKSSGVANETIANDADGSGWERLSDMSDHELAKHIMNELSSLLAGLGVPGNRPTSQLKLLGKAFQKKSLCLTRYVPGIRDLIKMRNDLTHAGPARAGLPDRSKFIKLFFEVKVCLLGLAQEKIPIRTRAGQSSQGFEEDAFLCRHDGCSSASCRDGSCAVTRRVQEATDGDLCERESATGQHAAARRSSGCE